MSVLVSFLPDAFAGVLAAYADDRPGRIYVPKAPPNDAHLRSLLELVDEDERARRSADAGERAALLAPQTGADPARLARALSDASLILCALERLDVVHGVGLVVTGAERDGFSRAALAWAKTRRIPTLSFSPEYGGMRAVPADRVLIADATVVAGERGRRRWRERGIPEARILPGENVWLAPSIGLVAERAKLRRLILPACGFAESDRIVVIPTSGVPARDLPLYAAVAAARRAAPLKLIVAEPAASTRTVEMLHAEISGFGIASADYRLIQGETERVIAIADVVLAEDSDALFAAAAQGIPAINRWTPRGWIDGPLVRADDGIVELSDDALGDALAALVRDPGLAGTIGETGRTALMRTGAFPSPARARAVADLLVARSTATPPEQPVYDFVVGIGDYRHTSAGVRVMHRLAHQINAAGARAAVLPFAATNPEWNTPHRNLPITDRTIAIYPEVESGNPLGAKRVVRYVLNIPGLLAGDTRYADDELVFYFHEAYRAAAQAATIDHLGPERYLRIPVVEPHLFFKDPQSPRSYDCLYLGKGEAVYDRGILPADLLDEPRVIRRDLKNPWPASRAETAALLRGARRVYSYDGHSTIVDEAIICGAAVFYVREDGTIDPELTTIGPDYVEEFSDLTHVRNFLKIVAERWPSQAC